MAFDLSMPILVVDDYSTMIRIIRNLLKQLGFENVDEVYFFSFEDGRIAEAWGLEDTLDRMRRLGLAEPS